MCIARYVDLETVVVWTGCNQLRGAIDASAQ